MTTTAAIDWGALGKVVWISIVAGVGLTAIVCITLIGSIRATEARTAGHRRAAVAYGILGGVGLAGVIAALVLGLIVMTSK
jgi:hypothetical protein